MGITAFILAKHNSIRLPEKNYKQLKGKPLISYTIEQAIDSGVFDEIVVSTDSDNVREIVKAYKDIKVVSQSPFHLTSEYALVEAMEQTQKNNYIMLLQTTSPFRKVETLVKAAEYLRTLPIFDEERALNSVISKDTSNDKVNGCIYGTTWNDMLQFKRFINPYYIFTDEIESIDIDTEYDWIMAEYYMERRII